MKKGLLVLALLSVLLVPAKGDAQEEKETPSQKTREAIEKFKKAPATAGQAMEALKEAGKAKLQEAPGGKQAAKAESGSLTLPAKKAEQPERPRYSSAGKRDPFRPLSLKPKVGQRTRENLSPLERYEIGQLKLVAVIWDIKEPKAMVEDATGLGYIVKLGTLIGPNEGKVKTIKPNEVVIEESLVDFLGARKAQEISMKLPVEQ